MWDGVRGMIDVGLVLKDLSKAAYLQSPLFLAYLQLCNQQPKSGNAFQ